MRTTRATSIFHSFGERETRRITWWWFATSLRCCGMDFRVGVPGRGITTGKSSIPTLRTTKEATLEMPAAFAAEPIPWNDRPWSVKLRVPPLAAVYLKPQRD